jgi:hypothetical protein
VTVTSNLVVSGSLYAPNLSAPATFSNAATFASNVTVSGAALLSNLTVSGSLNATTVNYSNVYSNVTVYTSETITSNLVVDGLSTLCNVTVLGPAAFSNILTASNLTVAGAVSAGKLGLGPDSSYLLDARIVNSNATSNVVAAGFTWHLGTPQGGVFGLPLFGNLYSRIASVTYARLINGILIEGTAGITNYNGFRFSSYLTTSSVLSSTSPINVTTQASGQTLALELYVVRNNTAGSLDIYVMTTGNDYPLFDLKITGDTTGIISVNQNWYAELTTTAPSGTLLPMINPTTFWDSVNNIYVTTTYQNNVGLGVNNSTPQYTLDVAGTIRASNVNATSVVADSLTTYSTLLGGSGTQGAQKALEFINDQSYNSLLSIVFGSNNVLNSAAELQYVLGASDTSNSRLNLGFYGNQPLTVTAYGSVGIGNSNPSYTLDVAGAARFTGNISKGGGTFDIVHPTLSNMRLVHSFVEGPRCDLIYRGKAALSNGKATVDLNTECVASPDCAMSDGTFQALCANPEVFLQNNETFDRVVGSVAGATLTITCENAVSHANVAWMVVAERQDPHIKEWNRTNASGYLVTQYASSN